MRATLLVTTSALGLAFLLSACAPSLDSPSMARAGWPGAGTPNIHDGLPPSTPSSPGASADPAPGPGNGNGGSRMGH